MCTCPSKFSKFVILGGSPPNPSSFQRAHTDSYTSLFSRLRRPANSAFFTDDFDRFRTIKSLLHAASIACMSVAKIASTELRP